MLSPRFLITPATVSGLIISHNEAGSAVQPGLFASPHKDTTNGGLATVLSPSGNSHYPRHVYQQLTNRSCEGTQYASRVLRRGIDVGPLDL